ncbi:MAG: hypothetical protein KDI51_05310 [Xanthomonadales bacterium]|nr:hypothetical protein [Xanthomonadales bacterium]
MRGFASRRKKKLAHTFCFERSGRVYEPNTAGVAAIRDFYSSATDTLLDDEITRKENGYCALLNHVRNGGELSQEQTETMSEFVVHLMARTRVIRTWMSDGIQAALEMMKSLALDPDVMGAELNNYNYPSSPRLLNLIRKTTRENGLNLSKNQLAAFALKASQDVRAKQSQLAEMVVRQIRMSLSSINVNTEERAAESHREALSQLVGGGRGRAGTEDTHTLPLQGGPYAIASRLRG